MSYILDALRRAEAERERGHVPGLHAQGVGTATGVPNGPAAAGNRWTLPVFAALVAAVTVLGWRLGTADKAASAPAPAAAVAPPAPVTSAAPAPLPAPAAERVAAPAPPPRASEPTALRAAAPAVAVVAKKRAALPASAAAADLPAAASASGAASVETKVYAVAELPPDVRQQLPQLAIGGSIYSASPASRFVIINGQLFHEGDTVAPGLVLQQIRLKSAVLAFRGYRYGITF